ncbi:MAG TPA: YraN family protein [Candidatus Dormibacteraeota bacterium]|nr:YraN family protein [Candidatus Dormibacteraeota bacterium]
MARSEYLRKAQAAAKTYLEMRGYEIVEQNWQQSKYKVDIIAKKDGILYFVEVKYRPNDSASARLDTLTTSTLKQVRLAALRWVTECKWPGDYKLAAIEIDNTNFAVLSFIDSEL